MKLKNLIIVIVIIFILAGVGLYFLLGRSGTNTAAPSGQTGSLPSTGNQQFPSGQNQGASATASSTNFGVISNEPVLDYFVDAQNRALVVEPDGEIKAVINGQVSVLSSSTFQNIANAAFSYDGKKIMVSFTNSAGLQTTVFDVASGSWAKLPAGMQSPVWSPTNYQVAYLQSGGVGSETIYTVNAGSSSAKPSAVGTIAAQDSMLQWPNKMTMVVSDKPDVYVAGSAWFFNLANQTLAPAVSEYPGLESVWSNTTTTMGLVFSANSGNSGGNISLIDQAGNSKSLSFDTLPSKCGFSMEISTSSPNSKFQAPSSSFVIYCAVPRDQQTFSVARLPDEYEQRVFFTADNFYKINLADGTLIAVFNDPSQTLDATKLKVFNNTLFFINRYDLKLYAISL